MNVTSLTFAADDGSARPLHLVTKEGLAVFLSALDPAARAWVEASGFGASAGEVVLIPASDGAVAAAAGGLGDVRDETRKRFVAASLRAKLPEGLWRLETALTDRRLAEAALGWLLAGYRFV